jgi:hypothetical protein
LNSFEHVQIKRKANRRESQEFFERVQHSGWSEKAREPNPETVRTFPRIRLKIALGDEEAAEKGIFAKADARRG